MTIPLAAKGDNHVHATRPGRRVGARRTALHLIASLALGIAALCRFAPALSAHEIRPTIVEAEVQKDTFALRISTNLEALMTGIGPEHRDTDGAPDAAAYKALRALPADQLRARFVAFSPRWLDRIVVMFGDKRAALQLGDVSIPADVDPALARIGTVTVIGQVPDSAHTFRWQYPIAFGSSILRVRKQGSDEVDATWLKDGRMSDPIPVSGAPQRSFWRLVADYVEIGFTHILPKGLDHILFVVGLYLLSPRIRPLLTQVTAFTVAHSITLGLGLYGIVALPPSIVEPLIALSITYVAIENLFTSSLSPWRPFVVFGFGLLHGLGFAGVLAEIGLPRADYATGLIAFNVGVELGQLAVIAVAFVLTGLWFRSRSWYRRGIVVPASVAIACIGLYWTVERIISGV